MLRRIITPIVWILNIGCSTARDVIRANKWSGAYGIMPIVGPSKLLHYFGALY